MSQLKVVGVKKLKNNLSAYLRAVQSGQTLLVTDRDRVIAELREATTSAPPQQLSLLDTWAQEGNVRLPQAPKTKAKYPPSQIALPDKTALNLLDEERGL